MSAFSDASFADDSEDRYRSTGGHAIFLCGNLVAWSFKKMKLVCTSTSEAEFVACWWYIELTHYVRNRYRENVLCQ